jgi:hypothetical protein
MVISAFLALVSAPRSGATRDGALVCLESCGKRRSRDGLNPDASLVGRHADDGRLMHHAH